MALREEFYKNVKVPGDANSLSKLDKAGRVADFLELG
jgi:succinate dehydrogenase / fumarate reductase flavoprotein subunit